MRLQGCTRVRCRLHTCCTQVLQWLYLAAHGLHTCCTQVLHRLYSGCTWVYGAFSHVKRKWYSFETDRQTDTNNKMHVEGLSCAFAAKRIKWLWSLCSVTEYVLQNEWVNFMKMTLTLQTTNINDIVFYLIWERREEKPKLIWESWWAEAGDTAHVERTLLLHQYITSSHTWSQGQGGQSLLIDASLWEIRQNTRLNTFSVNVFYFV